MGATVFIPEAALCSIALTALMAVRSTPGSQAAESVGAGRSEEHTSELQSRVDLVCRLLLEKKKKKKRTTEKKKKQKQKQQTRNNPTKIQTIKRLQEHATMQP